MYPVFNYIEVLLFHSAKRVMELENQKPLWMSSKTGMFNVYLLASWEQKKIVHSHETTAAVTDARTI